ncbi:hypothetical protein J4474_01945 [Candidatus Pacearchaeota archaeon]|nr:hypothetical protein [Candidatus Pacearchaeota archaeon]
MGLRPGKGPDWKKDSFGYSDTEVATLCEQIREENENRGYEILDTNPNVSRQYFGCLKDLD